ncbi:sll0787 family AIR synthase-like protein [Methylobacterium planeticum]|uniref:Sll0787 family AIR synthase-like protein n=2 Tax=Methylobacterium planeticum TaxID=2615211 RepID=A0A6N6MK73_9HYPH|nr:sll0787 family AIR synthase-like protein [Methylobacterium planeticum]
MTLDLPTLDLPALDLPTLARRIRDARGVAHKRDIDAVVARLGLGRGDAAVPVGDDCAAIPDGDGHLLLAIEGFLDGFVAEDPYFAGYCGIMVNLSDVAAMGGRPLAVVDALWSRGADAADPILAGLSDAAALYGVPVVGGHTNTRAASGNLAVAVLGRAGPRLLTSFDAAPGDDLIAVIDLRGRFRDPHPYWDASTGSPGARLRGDLALLPGLAEDGLACAAKDISMAGVVGTALMLLECSGVGGSIDLAAIPRPDAVPLDRWLTAFPSFGYVLGVRPDRTPAVRARFAERGLAAAAIGRLDASRVVRVRDASGGEAVVWDLRAGPLTGCGRRETNDA